MTEEQKDQLARLVKDVTARIEAGDAIEVLSHAGIRGELKLQIMDGPAGGQVADAFTPDGVRTFLVICRPAN